MNNKGITRAFTLSALFAAMLPVINASAAGYQLSEHGAAGTGRAHSAGAVAVDDASVVATNIAGMAFFDKAMFTGTLSYLKPNVKVTNLDTGYSDKRVGNEAVVPEFFYVAPINDQWSWGVGAYTNYGFITDYSSSSGITPAADYSDIQSYNLSYNLAFKPQDDFSMAFGLNAVQVKAELTTSIAESLGGMPTGSIMDMTGDDWGYGWKLGAMWEPQEGTRLGISYHSSVKTTLEGEVKSQVFVGQAPGIPNYNSDGSVDLELPEILEISVWQDINERLAVHASYMWTGWSSFDELAFELDSGVPIDAAEQNYQDSSRIAIGATYKYNETWTLRAGYAYDNSPVTNEDRHFSVPDSDRQWFSFGGNYKLSPNQSIDVGYAYLKAEGVNVEDPHPMSAFGGQTIRGKVESDCHIFSIQYNHSF